MRGFVGGWHWWASPVVSGISRTYGIFRPSEGVDKCRRLELIDRSSGAEYVQRMRRRSLGRSARTGLNCSGGFFGAFPRDTLALHLSLSFPFPKNRQNPLQRFRAAGHQPHETEEVLAWAAARMEVHQRHTNDSHIEVQQDPTVIVANQMVELGITFQPSEEELDLPAMSI